MPDTANADRAAELFSHVEAAYGTHPDFAANAGAIRDLIQKFVANPGAVGGLLKGLALVWPSAAVWLNGIAAVLAVLTPPAPAPSPAPPAQPHGELP